MAVRDRRRGSRRPRAKGGSLLILLAIATLTGFAAGFLAGRQAGHRIIELQMEAPTSWVES